MHLSLIILTTSAAALASAQVIFNTSTYQFICPSNPPNGAYCTGPSLTSNIIIRCSGTVGQAGNCNDNLAGVPPIGVKGFAPCYETTLTAGDAACSYSGTVYPDRGPSFPVPGPGSNNNNNNNSTSATPPLTATAASSNNISLPLIALSVSTSYVFISSSSSSSAAYTALGDNATLPTSAPYPIRSAANGTAAASGTVGSAPGKTGGSGGAFTGAAGRMRGPAFANLGAVVAAAAFGLVLLL